LSFAFNYAVKSVTGLVRDTNQDSGYASGNLLMVADGMGGHAGGDVASSIAIDVIEQLDHDNHTVQTAITDLEMALEQSRLALVRASELAPQLHGLGTTVVALLRAGPTIFMAHLGDSRAYLLRDGVLTQVTVDHTFVQYLIDMGRITPLEAETHPQRNVVMRVLSDFDLDLTPDVSVREAKVGDRWLLCSDGASGFISLNQMAAILKAAPTPTQAADELVHAALRNQSSDNVTCLVADIVLPGQETSSEVTKVGAAATGGPFPELVATVVAEAARRVGATEVADDWITEEIWLVPPAAGSDSYHSDPRIPADTEVISAVGAGGGPMLLDGTPVVLDGAPVVLDGAPPDATIAVGVDTEIAGQALEASGTPLVSLVVSRETLRPAETIEAHDDDPKALPAPKSRPWLALGVTLALVAALAFGIWRAYSWSQTQYYVGISEGNVAVFRGIPETIGPIMLSHPVQLFDAPVSDLPEFYLGRLGGSIRAESLTEAVERAERLISEAIHGGYNHGRARE
jgi:protein phosphatase